LAKGGRPLKTGSRTDPVYAATLEDQGIDKHLADRARKAAAMSEAKFEKHVDQARSRRTDRRPFETKIHRLARAAFPPPQPSLGAPSIGRHYPRRSVLRLRPAPVALTPIALLWRPQYPMSGRTGRRRSSPLWARTRSHALQKKMSDECNRRVPSPIGFCSLSDVVETLYVDARQADRFDGKHRKLRRQDNRKHSTNIPASLVGRRRIEPCSTNWRHV
jgi:hypothetical protein